MSKIDTSSEKIKDILTRGVEDVVVREDVEKKLASGKKLKIKHGVDPTTPDLHLGYAVVYLKLRELQDMGHTIQLLIGDFTARFGDPTQKDESRALRDKKEVREMAKHYIEQAGKILDMKKVEVHYNSEWHDKMSSEELLRITSRFTHQRMMERDMFQERIKSGAEIRLHELLYPVLQAYDSVMLKSDITVIGPDQIFNELQARKLQPEHAQEPQDLIATRLLIGTDGAKKMSQSFGNYIGIAEPPNEQYAKLMSVPDELIWDYFELITRVPVEEIENMRQRAKDGGLSPRDAKARMAFEVVALLQGKDNAEHAQKEFSNVFQKQQLPENMDVFSLSKAREIGVARIIVAAGFADSLSDAKRLIQQGAVSVDGEKVKRWDEKPQWRDGSIIKVGSHKFLKVEK